MSMVAGQGYAWTSPSIPKLNGDIDPEHNPLKQPITLLEESWIASLQSLGAICGPLFTGPLSNKIGKKRTIILFFTTVLISDIILIVAKRVIHFYIARFMIGVGTGCVLSLIPLYVAEISDVSQRGSTSILISLSMTSFQLFTYIIGPFITIRTMAIISLVPSLLFIISFGPFVPESPYQLVFQNRMDEAKQSLKKLRGHINVDQELEEIILTVRQTQTKIIFRDLFQHKVVKKCMIISLGVLFFQQCSGIVAIISYLQTIFDSSGGAISGDKSVMLVGLVQFLTVIIVIKLVTCVGRKTLILYSFSGLFISLVTLGMYFYLYSKGYNMKSVSWLPIVCVCFYIFCFNFGIGPVSWTILGEIFPQNLKSHLSSMATFAMFFTSFLITLIFPSLSEYLGVAGTLWIFAGFAFFGIIFVYIFIPETKDKTFLEIQKLLEE